MGSVQAFEKVSFIVYIKFVFVFVFVSVFTDIGVLYFISVRFTINTYYKLFNVLYLGNHQKITLGHLGCMSVYYSERKTPWLCTELGFKVTKQPTLKPWAVSEILLTLVS